MRKGYSTGVHAVIAFRYALESYRVTHELCCVETQKMDNLDLDVTKGCWIGVSIAPSLEMLACNPLPHKPFIFSCGDKTLALYAGVGVGVVTKEGLKTPKGYPAINPTPLEAMRESFMRMAVHGVACISIRDGELLAHQSANAKVGVMGGLSILGTTGFVKPVSSEAYWESLKVEIHSAVVNDSCQLVFTLGESALTYAKEYFREEEIIDTGNFVYDAISYAFECGLQEGIFLCGIGKMVKIAQGCKNTHNRYGDIDFIALQRVVMEHLGVRIDCEKTRTVKGVSAQVCEESFIRLIEKMAQEQFHQWGFKVKTRCIKGMSW